MKWTDVCRYVVLPYFCIPLPFIDCQGIYLQIYYLYFVNLTYYTSLLPNLGENINKHGCVLAWSLCQHIKIYILNGEAFRIPENRHKIYIQKYD